jgi:hypothetical protein
MRTSFIYDIMGYGLGILAIVAFFTPTYFMPYTVPIACIMMMLSFIMGELKKMQERKRKC